MSHKLFVVIGTGFQHVIDSYFWYMPFCSVRQCKHVMDVVAKIPEEEWVAKRNEIRAEHNRPGSREELQKGFKNWIASSFHKQRRAKDLVVPASTKLIEVED